MSKDFEHVDVNDLVQDVPLEELPELEIKPARRAKKDKSEEKKPLQKLDEKLVAPLSAAAILNANEKLMDLFARAKKKGKVDSSEMMDVLYEIELDGDQMEQDFEFVLAFARRMARAKHCPFPREMPEDIRKKLDHYLGIKRNK